MKSSTTVAALYVNAFLRPFYFTVASILTLISLSAAQIRETEFNDSFSHADTLKPGSSIHASFSRNDLVDVFMFNVQATVMYNCNSFCDYEKQDLSSSLQADVFAGNDTSVSVLHGNPSGRYGKFGFRLAGWLPPKTGWYYLILRYKASAAPIDSVKYQVRLTYGAPITVAALHHEIDDVVSEAQNRTPVPTDGAMVHGYLYRKTGIYNWNDLDLYRFEGQKGQSMVAETFTAATLSAESWFIRDADTEIALLDQDGNKTGYTNDDKETTAADPWETTTGMNNTFSRIQIESLPYTGSYYIRVNSFYNSITQNEDPTISDANPGGGEYLLSVKLTKSIASSLQFEIFNQDSGMPLPGKMTAIGVSGTPTQGVYKFLHSVDGRGTMALASGSYTLVFSHGPEFSMTEQSITLADGETAQVSARLTRLLDTRGYICGDMHMHALEGIEAPDKFGVMLTALVAEGVEYAVATDHNAISDYGPRALEMGLQNYIKTSPGDEISTAIGHINAWPLNTAGPAVISNGTAKKIFTDARNKGAQIVQINHPRWPGIDYFTKMNLDPLTGFFGNLQTSEDFDAMELLNETEGWGFEAKPPTHPLSVVEDWFHLLNRGKRFCSVGNSDAHGINGDKPGYPRNYIASSAEKPGEIDENELFRSIRNCRVTVCDGHFTTFTINETGQIGDLIKDTDGAIKLAIRVQALPEISVDSVTVYGNGNPVAAFSVPSGRDAERFVKVIELHPTRDTWYAVISRGNTDIPIGLIMDDSGPVKPIGITNPIWVDVDGNGVFDAINSPTGVEALPISTPIEFSLAQNYPNPFNPSTTIEYTLPRSEHVVLCIYTLLGKEVAKLVDERLPAGIHKIVWNADKLANGVYFIKVEAGSFLSMRKAVLMK